VELRAGRGKVLILTPQAMTGALLGMLVELAQLEPVFAEPNERAEDALTRLSPLLVVVADSGVDSFMSDLFIARAQHRGIAVIAFGISDQDKASDWATQRGIRYLRLPTDGEAFGRILDQAIRNDRRSRLAGDRRSPRVERGVDGTLIFQAESGERWYVYDRRAGERRRIEQPPPSQAYRVFVSQTGLELRVPLEPDEFKDKTAEALEKQLARAKG
jgi:hypothetical protein